MENFSIEYSTTEKCPWFGCSKIHTKAHQIDVSVWALAQLVTVACPSIQSVLYQRFYYITHTHTHARTHAHQVFKWIQELTSPSTREHALIELSRKREVLPDLAPMLWHSFGTMAALLQEIVMIYPVINPPTLTVCQIHMLYVGRWVREV